DGSLTSSGRAANLYPDKQSAVDASRSARDLLQLISLPLRDAKSVSTNLTFLADRGANRLFFEVAVLHRRLRSRQRGSDFSERHCSPPAGPLQWLLPVFIRALRKPFGLPGKPFGFN